MRKIFIRVIRGYQQYFSPLLGAHCRFEPSCSEYLRQAIEEKGILQGVLLGLWRILRCQPLSCGGWDPVPGHFSRAKD